MGALILDFVWFDLDFFFGKMRERAITILLEDRFPDFLLRFCFITLDGGRARVCGIFFGSRMGSCIRIVINGTIACLLACLLCY